MTATQPGLTTTSPLRGRTLVLMRTVWVSITGLAIGLVITAAPIRFEKVQTAAPDIRAPEFRDLITAGVSPDTAATLDLAVTLLFFAALFGGGIWLFLRGSNLRETIILSLTLILLGATFSGLTTVHRTVGSPFSQSWPGFLATILVLLSTWFNVVGPFWFPQGRFISRWTALLAALLVATEAVLYLFVSFPRSHDLVNIVGLGAFAAGIWAQAAHYRQVLNPVTRQQIKWAVIGIVVACVGFLMLQAATLLVGSRAGLAPRIFMVLSRLVAFASQVALFVCFAIAIRRYRLWHVDLVINRSLVYGSVTALLVLVFLGGGFLLQTVVGQQNAPIAFAISIVAAGLLFNPVRNFVQRFVDRRIYGFRFDLNDLNRAQQFPEIENPGVLTGQRLGNYRVLGVLGKGGMGEVYQGEGDGRKVAIKIVPGGLTRQAELRKWFERESRALAAFDHPNIVKFYETGESNGVSYMVLDFIEGRELSDIIKERGRMPFDELRRFVGDIATALDYAHERGLVHRDIKPSNIMMRRKSDGETLEAVLMDFGIAKINDARTRATSTGAVGTIHYMAPEQIMAAGMVDHRADIYALGVMLYEMLTGQVPFDGNPAQVLFAHLQQRPRDPSELVPDLPANAAQCVMRALEKKPEDRFESAGALAVALGRV